MHPALDSQLISLRREFHMYPEAGWTEFRTTARIVQELLNEGIPVRWGKDIHSPENMPGMPSQHILEQSWQRALEQTGLEDILLPMKGGFTGCIAEIRGANPGKTTVFRVDIDACQLEECHEPSHFPAKEGFASRHAKCMHACGHDAHAAIGVGAAKLLWQNRDKLHGTVYVLFQPAEEGLRGAASMNIAALPHKCDRLIGLHVGVYDYPVGTVAVSSTGFLSSTKLDAVFHGKAAHAGICPELGRNAMAAGAKAVLQLLDLPNKHEGLCRVNVGTFHAGTGRNVIPAEAHITIETRSDCPDKNTQLSTEAQDICKEAAKACGCTVDILPMGGANTSVCDESLAEDIAKIISDMPEINKIYPSLPFGGSEDITTMMNTVQQRGGKATEMILCTPLIAPHHNDRFDTDEKVIGLGAEILKTLGLSLE